MPSCTWTAQTVTTLKYIFDIFYFVYTHIACIIAIQTGGKRGWRARHQRTLLSNVTPRERLYTPLSLTRRQLMSPCVRGVWNDASNRTYVSERPFPLQWPVFTAGYEMWKGRNSFCAYQMYVFSIQRRTRWRRLLYSLNILFLFIVCVDSDACRSLSMCIPVGQLRNMPFSLFPQQHSDIHSRGHFNTRLYTVRARTHWHLFSSRKRCHALALSTVYARKRDKCTRPSHLTAKIDIAIEVDGYRCSKQTRECSFIAIRIQTTDSYKFGHNEIEKDEYSARRIKKRTCKYMPLTRRRYSLSLAGRLNWNSLVTISFKNNHSVRNYVQMNHVCTYLPFGNNNKKMKNSKDFNRLKAK